MIPDRFVNKSDDLRSLISGDMKDADEDDEHEEEWFPESGEWLPELRVMGDRAKVEVWPLDIDPLLHTMLFDGTEEDAKVGFPPLWLFELLNRAFTNEEGGDGRGGTVVQLTKSASSGPTISLKSSKDSSVKGNDVD